jgi:hypothetical protein
MGTKVEEHVTVAQLVSDYDRLLARLSARTANDEPAYPETHLATYKAIALMMSFTDHEIEELWPVLELWCAIDHGYAALAGPPSAFPETRSLFS